MIRGRLGDLAGERADLEKRLEATTLEGPALAAELETARELMSAAEADLEASRAVGEPSSKARGARLPSARSKRAPRSTI